MSNIIKFRPSRHPSSFRKYVQQLLQSYALQAGWDYDSIIEFVYDSGTIPSEIVSDSDKLFYIYESNMARLCPGLSNILGEAYLKSSKQVTYSAFLSVISLEAGERGIDIS